MTNEKQTLRQLLEASDGRKLLFLGREGIFTQKEIERFLKKYGVSLTQELEEGVAGVVEHQRLNPVEEDISNDAYERKLPLFKLREFEQLLSEEINDDELLMGIKLTNDQERILRLLGNEHISDALFVKLLKMYRFNEEEEDNRDDRDVIMYTLRRYIDIKPSEEDLLYSYLTLRRLASEADDPELLKALMGFPNFEFLVRGKEKITLRETIARNPALDEETVRKLLSLRDTKVNTALAGNRCILKEVMKLLLSKGDESTQMALAANDKIDDEIFAALLEKSPKVVSLLLIRQPVNRKRLEMIEGAGLDAELFALIGANVSLYEDVIEVLAAYEEPQLLAHLSGNSSVAGKVLASIYQKGMPHTFVHLAKNPAVPVEILQELYEKAGDDTVMLAALAHNPSLPQPLLQALFEKDDLEINRGLATNASLPMELLDILKVDTRLQNELAQNEQLARSYEQVLRQDKVMMNV